MDLKLAISSMSLGRCFAGHSFEHKLDMAQKYGYKGIEIFYEDLEDVAHRFDSQHGRAASEDASPSTAGQLEASHWIREQCRRRDLSVISLQPFMNYEGLRDRQEHARRIVGWHLWLRLAHALGTDLILVPSTFLPADKVSGDLDARAADLRELADLAAATQPPIRVCYESLCWGTCSRIWEDSWAVVQRADRPNLGICLDSFNIAGAIYADPARASGKTADADQAVTASMARLLATVPRHKVFLAQLVDAERLEEPLVRGHAFFNPEQPARMSWSRNCRLFYGEDKAYLPVLEISQAIFYGLGYRGWVSLELFNRRMSDTDAAVPEELARRGAVSWERLRRDLSATSASAASKAPMIASAL